MVDGLSEFTEPRLPSRRPIKLRIKYGIFRLFSFKNGGSETVLDNVYVANYIVGANKLGQIFI